MKRNIAFFLACTLLLLSLAGCGTRYQARDLIGKTSAEITAQFGPFDCVIAPADEDGLYRNTRCGYTVSPPRRGFLGRSEEILFFITFDANGVATACAEGYRPGG